MALTIEQVDEALANARRVPRDELGSLGQAFIDRLECQRIALSPTKTLFSDDKPTSS